MGRFRVSKHRGNVGAPRVYIKDLIESLRRALESDEAVGQTMIVGGNAAITTEELIASYCKVFELPSPRIRTPCGQGGC